MALYLVYLLSAALAILVLIYLVYAVVRPSWERRPSGHSRRNAPYEDVQVRPNGMVDVVPVGDAFVSTVRPVTMTSRVPGTLMSGRARGRIAGPGRYPMFVYVIAVDGVKVAIV